jgi:hypothetical protein
LGNPVVPLENNRAKIVVFAILRSSKRSQSASPWSSNVRHDLKPGGTVCPGSSLSKIRIFEAGILVCSAAARTLCRSSGSVINTFICANLTACASS